ncbi:MAG: hypothetical protein NTY38_20310 [Acidobacteria bacterium]|nr:hypothetical protein [Acidobacteriota bacterium]
MSPGQLRSFIPIAAPARREAADGSEAALRLVLGFEPTWFSERCGADFSARWHRDPLYRRQSLERMRDELNRAFPWSSQWRGPAARDLHTIAGCFGVGVIPAVFGIPLRYYPNRWPHVEAGHELSTEAIGQLDAERLLAGPFVEELLAQVDRAASLWGAVYGDLNWQGVLNCAFHIRGQQIFEDMVDTPDLAQHLFATIREVIIRLARSVQQRQRSSGFDIDYMCVSNCTMSMISPAMYTRLLRPHDERIAQSFARFGVHTCNWDATPYLAALSKLPQLGYVDMGIDSDFEKARALCPEARRAVVYTPGRIFADPESLRADFEKMAHHLAPCDVVVADIPWDTPDHIVERLHQTCAQVRNGGTQ